MKCLYLIKDNNTPSPHDLKLVIITMFTDPISFNWLQDGK